MKKVLVSLISDQLIPNLLFIKEKQQEVGGHIFVTTKYMEGRGAADRLAKVAGLSAGTWGKVEVIEDSLDDIREKLAAMNLTTSNRYLLNLTGGTKIMSIGVSRFFEEYDHESYYSTIGKNSFKRIFPRDDDREQAFSNELSLSDYLEAYGFSILKSGLPAWVTQELANGLYMFNLLKYRSEIKELSEYSQKNRGKIYVIPNTSKLNRLLQEVSWKPNTNNHLSPEEIQFLISGWWEAFSYFKLKNDLKLNNDAIAVNCHIAREQVENELDVVFVRNNKLFVAECKTGFSPLVFKERFNNAIYKMAAVRNNMGLRIPGFLFMLDAKVRENGVISPLYAGRAKIMDTTIIDPKVLDSKDEWPLVLEKIS
jgi:hypothetical protein